MFFCDSKQGTVELPIKTAWIQKDKRCEQSLYLALNSHPGNKIENFWLVFKSFRYKSFKFSLLFQKRLVGGGGRLLTEKSHTLVSEVFSVLWDNDIRGQRKRRNVFCLLANKIEIEDSQVCLFHQPRLWRYRWHLCWRLRRTAHIQSSRQVNQIT